MDRLSAIEREMIQPVLKEANLPKWVRLATSFVKSIPKWEPWPQDLIETISMMLLTGLTKLRLEASVANCRPSREVNHTSQCLTYKTKMIEQDRFVTLLIACGKTQMMKLNNFLSLTNDLTGKESATFSQTWMETNSKDFDNISSNGKQNSQKRFS